jgi:hypothetical protein
MAYAKKIFSVPHFGQSSAGRLLSLLWRLSLHGGYNTYMVGMDELETAAAVLAMTVDSDFEDEMGLEAVQAKHAGDLHQRQAPELALEEKENEHDIPEAGIVGAATHKV